MVKCVNFHRNPLITGRIEPGQPQVVAAVQVRVLAVREPPATLVVAGAVRVRDVPVDVYRRELHVILVLERVRRVATVPAQVQPEATVPRIDPEAAVIGEPGVVVDVLHDDAQPGTVVLRQVVQRLVADPELAGRCAEPLGVLFPGAVKVNRTVLAPLHRRPLAEALCH